MARLLVGGIFCALLPVLAEAEKTNATEIVRQADEAWRGARSYAKLKMTVKRPNWTRTLEMEGWTEGTRKSFIRVLSPPKENGVTFLKKGREAWQYVPAIDRIIKIPPSMMLQSWMGSDFTNDDVVRADSLVVDYEHRITSETEESGVARWIIEAIPKPDAAVVWGKVLLDIRKSNFVADKVSYFDEDGSLIKYYETSEIRVVDEREVPMHLVMTDFTREGHSTTLHYEVLTLKPEMRPDTFTLRNLRR